MTSVDDIRKEFSQKLEQEISSRKFRLDAEIQQFRDTVPLKRKMYQPGELISSIGQIESVILKNRQAPPPLPFRPNTLIDMTNSDPLTDLDQAFLSMFHLSQYFRTNKLLYPTVLCETLEEFFTPFVSSMNFSDQTRQQELKHLISEAREIAVKNKGGIFGVNFPGQGCYLNGWLFASLANIQPGEVNQNPEVFQRVLSTAIHEKLGHGFLSVYSSLGELKTSLGLSLVQISSQFGLAPSDDAVERLRYQQNALLFTVSQFLEEGWATWIENYLEENLFHTGKHPNHSFDSVVKAIQRIPDEFKDVEQIKESFMQALGILFGDEDQSMSDLLHAIKFLANAGSQLDDYFSSAIHQPLRYALGELICMQCEVNLGVACVPYAALIAGNLTFDPTKISAADLSTLLAQDPRLNPDARLASISRIKLNTPGNVKELTQKVNSELSLSIPVEIR